MSSRRAQWLVLAVVLAVGAAWAGASELPGPARVATVVLVAVLPALLLGQAFVRDDDVAELPVMPVYASSIAMILLIGAFAVWAGLRLGMTPATLGLRPIDPVRGLAWTGAVVAVALGFAVASRLLGQREAPLLERLLPRTGPQRAVFVLLSLSAGVGEELAFRGFLIPALETATGSSSLAVIVSSLAFGMLHSYQRSAGVLRAGALGVVLAAPLLATGSLYPSIAAHALFDLIAGLLLAVWLIGRPTDEGGPDRRH
jgi:membrane protease YdiL (CAAX protease family)